MYDDLVDVGGSCGSIGSGPSSVGRSRVPHAEGTEGEYIGDPLQFAYRPHRGVEDATVTLFNSILSHLEGPGSHARLLFVDFSSAFNTIQPNILTKRLLEQFDVSKNLAGWILNFLTCRTQRVRINWALSDPVCSSTGSPQGCV